MQLQKFYLLLTTLLFTFNLHAQSFTDLDSYDNTRWIGSCKSLQGKYSWARLTVWGTTLSLNTVIYSNRQDCMEGQREMDVFGENVIDLMEDSMEVESSFYSRSQGRLVMKVINDSGDKYILKLSTQSGNLTLLVQTTSGSLITKSVLKQDRDY